MRKDLVLFPILAILITDAIFFTFVKADVPEPHTNVITVEKADVYDEVFGIDYGTDFVPGYYEPIVDENIPLTPTEQMEVSKICDAYGIDYYLLLSMMYEESRFDRDAENKSCKGILQLNSKFHDVDDYFDVIQNAEGGCKYMQKLLSENDLPLALMIWHGESDAKVKYKNGTVSSYARRIMERRDLYADTVKCP